ARPFILRGRVEEDFGAVTITVDGVEFLDGGRAVRSASPRPAQIVGGFGRPGPFIAPPLKRS
ncbi:MAG: hypothetical protein V3U83_03515, partial [Acidobacteriota bacterium]